MSAIASISMLFPSYAIWERLEFTHGLMTQTALRLEALVNSYQNYEAENPDTVALVTNPNTVATALAFISCLILGSISEVATTEILFCYGIMSGVYLAYLVMLQKPLETIILGWFLPNLTYLAACTVITVFRRAFLSRLGRFPGPKKAAISNYWMAKEISNGTFSKTVKELHKKHNAKVVRTGPNELSVNDPEAIVKIYGGKYQRGTMYEGGTLKNQFNIKDTRSQYHHTIWRRIWEKAFTTSHGEARSYSSQIDSAVYRLLKVLKRKNGEEINAATAINNFALDLSADVTYGEDMEMQTGSGDENYLKSVEKYLSWFGFYGTLRNLVQVIGFISEPAIVKDFRFRNDRLLIQRQKRGGASRDITSFLLLEDEQTRRKFQVPRQLSANTTLSMLMGVATGTTITQALNSLAKEQDVQKKLRAELDAHLKSGGDLSAESIKNLPYLNGVVNEALRLHNPLPLGTHAVVPETGINMGSYKLPASVQVYVPALTIMTDENYFPQAEEFIPERWTEEKPELVADKRAFIPWGYGIRSCPGRQLALTEMRVTIARVIREFEIDVNANEEQEELKYYPIALTGDVMLKFKTRKL